MNPLKAIMQQAVSGMQLETQRITVAAENISNVDTPDDGYVTMSNVSLIMEMADLRGANRTYEANLNAFQQARSMYTSLLDILRR